MPLPPNPAYAALNPQPASMPAPPAQPAAPTQYLQHRNRLSLRKNKPVQPIPETPVEMPQGHAIEALPPSPAPEIVEEPEVKDSYADYMLRKAASLYSKSMVTSIGLVKAKLVVFSTDIQIDLDMNWTAILSSCVKKSVMTRLQKLEIHQPSSY